MHSLADLRKKLDWSREKIARALIVSAQSIQNIEKGKNFNLTVPNAMADAWGISVESGVSLCRANMDSEQFETLLKKPQGGSNGNSITGVPDVKGRSPKALSNKRQGTRNKTSGSTKHAAEAGAR